ncbi:MAG: hypothetical protein WC686_03000 [Candidatus Shapirobacteria bacterium]|jgi:hypothetical protein
MVEKIDLGSGSYLYKLDPIESLNFATRVAHLPIESARKLLKRGRRLCLQSLPETTEAMEKVLTGANLSIIEPRNN